MEDEGRKEGWKEMKQAGRRARWWRQWALLGAALALAVSPMGGAVALAEAETIFQQLPARFTLTSGIGGWQCILQIEADGAFTGRYWDEDSGDCAAEYPRGTVYLCGFSGQFAEPEMAGPYSCTMKLARLETAGRPGTRYLRQGTRWVYVQPWGFEEAETFMLYLPGAEMAGLPQGFLDVLRGRDFLCASVCRTAGHLSGIGGAIGGVRTQGIETWADAKLSRICPCSVRMYEK